MIMQLSIRQVPIAPFCLRYHTITDIDPQVSEIYRNAPRKVYLDIIHVTYIGLIRRWH